MTGQPADFYSYDVAISFAGQDRAVAEQLANALSSHNLRVFYDRWEEADLLGQNLYQHFSLVYVKFCLVLVSAHYARKAWPKLELRAAQARASGLCR